MTAEEITLEKFKDITVRCVNQDGKGMIPVLDIANAVNIDRSNLSKLLTRNEKFFSEYKGVVKFATPGGVQPLVCLTRDGVMGLLFKVDAMRSKDIEMQDRIIEFQHWATEILSKHHTGQTIQTVLPIQTPIELINERLDVADIAVKRSGVPKEIAHAMAWATGDVKEISLSIAGYIKAQSTVQLQLPAASQEDIINYDKHFSITKVAAALKLPIDKVRNVLESLNIIYFENGFWKLTKHGEQYGKMFMVTPGYPYRTNQKCYIKYNPMLIDLLKKYFDIEMPVTKVE